MMAMKDEKITRMAQALWEDLSSQSGHRVGRQCGFGYLEADHGLTILDGAYDLVAALGSAVGTMDTVPIAPVAALLDALDEITINDRDWASLLLPLAKVRGFLSVEEFKRRALAAEAVPVDDGRAVITTAPGVTVSATVRRV